MVRLTQPGVHALSYFELCRELRPSAVDEMVRKRILDLRWLDPVTKEGDSGDDDADDGKEGEGEDGKEVLFGPKVDAPVLSGGATVLTSDGRMSPCVAKVLFRSARI